MPHVAEEVTEVLVVIWFAAAIVGTLAAVVAAVAAKGGRPLLLCAGSCLAVTGILGILSIGIIFLGLSVACFIAAGRIGRRTDLKPLSR